MTPASPTNTVAPMADSGTTIAVSTSQARAAGTRDLTAGSVLTAGRRHAHLGAQIARAAPEAIVVSDVNLGGYQPRVAIGEILRFIRYLAGDDSIAINGEVAASETATGFRNIALANYMRAFGNVRHAADLVLGLYVHQCAIEMSCRQLALAGRYLMLNGRHPDGGRVVPPGRARRINALMLTCGQYDASGDFAFRVGIPSKSGVGGGILGIVPGRASIAVWSPGLSPSGNSHLGTQALEMLAQRTGWSVFSPPAG